MFREHIEAVEATGEWPVFVIGNHDILRSWNRYGDGQHNDQIAKDMAAMYLTLRGTPIMYYGEEIGMQNNDPTRREDVQDPIGRRGWPQEKGRDGERTPMQWSSDPMLDLLLAFRGIRFRQPTKIYNVADELKDPNSILNWYKSLLALRHTNPALLDGDYIPLNENDRMCSPTCGNPRNEAVIWWSSTCRPRRKR